MIMAKDGIVTMSEDEYFKLKFPPPQMSNDQNIKVIVTDYLTDRGFKRNLQGFEYLRYAILECVADKNKINKIVQLYTDTAIQYNSSSQKVERSMRHAISRSDMDKIPNSEFVASASDDIRLLLEL